MIKYLETKKIDRTTVAHKKDAPSWNMMVHSGKDLVKKLNLQQYVTPPRMFHPWHELTNKVLAFRVKKPSSGPYVWYGSGEPDLSSLKKDDQIYTLSLSGSSKYTYSAELLNNLYKLL